jgi:hypothetical protein
MALARSTLRIGLAALLVAIIATSAYLVSRPSPNSSGASMTGSMFVSDAGRSHGGFEYTATWNVTLELSGSSGMMNLLLNVGLGDALTKHQFVVTGFTKNSTDVSMKIDSLPVTLVLVENDAIWNGTFDHYYVASWGGDAPQGEVRGTISPTIFPGLTGSWYVELRLR